MVFTSYIFMVINKFNSVTCFNATDLNAAGLNKTDLNSTTAIPMLKLSMLLTTRFVYRRLGKLFAVALLVFLSSACTWLANLSVPAADKVDSLLEQHQYNSLLMLADTQLKKSLDPEQLSYWQSVSERSKSGAAQYQLDQLAAIKKMMRRNDWHQANTQVNLLKQHLPANDTLDQFLQKFDTERQSHIDALARSLVKLESKHLPQTLPLYERLFHADLENATALERLQRERDKRDRIIQAMQGYATQAERQQEYGLALNYIRTIQRFDDSPAVLADIKRLRALQAEQQKQIIASGKDKVLSKAEKQQLSDYGLALKDEQWLEAKDILDKMLKQRPGNGELLGQKTYLAEVFADEVAQAKELGESYYSTGNIEAALSIWNHALPMAPGDIQLTGNIERAQRILEKVKTLKEGVQF